MKKFLLTSLSILLLSGLVRSSVVIVTLDAPIHPVTSEYIRNSIEKAEKTQASLVIIKMNTPGGLDSSMREIIEKIISSSVPVVTYVSPSGARAASAGFFIGIASDLFIMAPGTNTGAAHPVGISITGQSMDESMADKVTHDAASYIKTLAEKRGRNMKLAEAAVRESLSYTEKEALEGNLIEFIALNEFEIIDHFDGKKINRFDGAETVLRLEGQQVIDLPMSARQKFLLTISNPNLAYILLMLGLLGLYFEFSNPGAILPGVLGAISLLLAIFSFQILPINYVGLILIFLSIGLFILEVKIQSYGILSIGGITAMVIGSMMLINSPIPELRPSLKFIIPVALGLSLIFIFLISLAIKAYRSKVTTGQEGLIGETGTAQTDINPRGKVFIHGELWNAESDEEISKSSPIKVIAMRDHLTLKVKKED